MTNHGGFGMVATMLLAGSAIPPLLLAMADRSAPAEPAPGPYARIAIMRALDGHGVDFEAGYVRHLEWHRQVQDPFRWYSWSVWASSERQRWIVYATFGHTAESLNHPVAPADDERDNILNVLPHAQFLGNGIYEFLPALSKGNGVPTPALRADYTTVELHPGAGKAFEAALAAEQPRLQGETLWYRLVTGGHAPSYVRLRPRASLAVLLDERADLPLSEKANGPVSRVIVETLSLRPNMLVNVTPSP